jgi:hypothetical protein
MYFEGTTSENSYSIRFGVLRKTKGSQKLEKMELTCLRIEKTVGRVLLGKTVGLHLF